MFAKKTGKMSYNSINFTTRFHEGTISYLDKMTHPEVQEY